MPTQAELEEAITHTKTTLDDMRARGIDGPTLWAVEDRLNALLDQHGHHDAHHTRT
jgi:hypothetical protein